MAIMAYEPFFLVPTVRFPSFFAMSRNLALALIATMITIGVGMSFSVRYLLWGFYHGTGLVVWRLYRNEFDPGCP
jgi:D-alanyl-lipoteichoic acid acyltransferase DltB (MBOAT superfamily)